MGLPWPGAGTCCCLSAVGDCVGVVSFDLVSNSNSGFWGTTVHGTCDLKLSQ
jgi:hypothetical protein